MCAHGGTVSTVRVHVSRVRYIGQCAVRCGFVSSRSVQSATVEAVTNELPGARGARGQICMTGSALGVRAALQQARSVRLV